jgi:hypothetical protein
MPSFSTASWLLLVLLLLLLLLLDAAVNQQ